MGLGGPSTSTQQQTPISKDYWIGKGLLQDIPHAPVPRVMIQPSGQPSMASPGPQDYWAGMGQRGFERDALHAAAQNPATYQAPGVSLYDYHRQMLGGAPRTYATPNLAPPRNFGSGGDYSQGGSSQPQPSSDGFQTDPLAMDAYKKMMGGGVYGGVIPQQSTAYPPNPWTTLQSMGFPNQQGAANARNSSTFGASPWQYMFNG